MDKIFKITRIIFFMVWSLVGLFILTFLVGLYVSNPIGKIEQGLKQLEKINQSNTSANPLDKNRQANSTYLSLVLNEKMKTCFLSVLGEKRFGELDGNLGSITKNDQEKLIPCISQDSFTRQPFGITGYTSVIISPAPTEW